MSESIGKVGIEVSLDNGKLQADIDAAKKTIRSFGKDLSENVGKATKEASRSIDQYVRNLQTVAATQGKSARETELYKLALRGASAEQLGAANNALKLADAYQKGQAVGAQLRTGFVTIATAAAAAAVAIGAGTISLINQVGKYQDLSDKIGDTGSRISSLKTASDVSGVSLDAIASASVRLTASLSKTSEGSNATGKAVKTLGLNFQDFKKLSPVQQLDAVAKAFEKFADGSEKTAVAVGLFGKSGGDTLKFLKEYASTGIEAAYVTDAQVKAADDFSDALAGTGSKLESFLQVAAVDTIPIIRQIGNLFSTLADNQGKSSFASDLVKDSINALVKVFQVVVGIGSDVIFVFKVLRLEAGAAAAKIAALAQLDFRGFKAISEAVKSDTARARVELDKFQTKLAAIGTPVDSRLSTELARRRQSAEVRPKLDTRGLVTDKQGTNTAAQEAKAQLALDIEDIRKAEQKLSNTISNREKLVQAQRSANLISEADYYAQKKANIEENNQVQINAAQQELARLQQEKLTGKDRIENQRKIVDAQAKIDKLRADGAKSIQILGIEEKSALDKISRAYDDARIAAQSYFDLTERGRQLELDGIGQGQRARDKAAAIQQIRDKYEQQRQDLQRANRDGQFAGRQADYDRELSLINEFQDKSITSYTQYYDKLDAQRGNSNAGAKEALQNYFDESKDTFTQTQNLITDSFKGAEDALVSFVTTGKLSFKGLADSILADLTRIAIKQSITGPLSQALNLGAGTGSSGGDIFSTLFSLGSSLFGGAPARAAGGNVSAGGLFKVNEKGPELLKVAGSQYLMMGDRPGSVTPNNAIGGKTVNVTVNQSFASNTSRATVAQAAANARRQLEAGARNL